MKKGDFRENREKREERRERESARNGGIKTATSKRRCREGKERLGREETEIEEEKRVETQKWRRERFGSKL